MDRLIRTKLQKNRDILARTDLNLLQKIGIIDL